ncbi:hypothetical protein [Leptothoe spongobia]|uniref:Uncharacterized protein n=1 Tax=Leptothoe spongobia TAU-MAC 1115 TaxID=1967444 RepID=A0A947GG23_9CYAN|nr:hypothetical protein [Leptothoe spongobia]MBT9313903.1 hypothetical protein [Leptothoe spongobia TAU-MAC 1115]
MDKRHQLRQSAVADFMQSLEHLDELLGEPLVGEREENVLPDSGSKASEPENAKVLPLSSHATQNIQTTQPSSQQS